MKRIFISSTFRDMNQERDLLQEQVLPKLNAAAREYGDSVSLCDLRWGVNTAELESEEGSRKVLSVCLDEIDRCRPYMIVILGERYGWIPQEALIADVVCRRDLALEELEKSVTALEIEYGALSDSKQLERTLFYFRELEGEPPEEYKAESDRHRKKLEALKARIHRATSGRIKTYPVRWDPVRNGLAGLETFADMVYADVHRLLLEQWQENAKLSAYQRDLRGQWEFIRQKTRQFSARHALVDAYLAKLKSVGLFAISGPSGAGKSTLMSQLALTLEQQGYEVLPIFCGSTTLCSTKADLERYLVDYLETRLGVPHLAQEIAAGNQEESYGIWRIRLSKLLEQWRLEDRTLVILIDALDQLTAAGNPDVLQFLPWEEIPHVKWVLSGLDTFPFPERIPVEPLEALPDQDRQMVVNGILWGLGRELAQPVINAIIQKSGAHNPLYLSLLVHRLTMMNRDDFARINALGGGMDAITACQLEIIRCCGESAADLGMEITEAAAQRVGGSCALLAARLIAAARFGLREQDLAGAAGNLGESWSSLDFSMFIGYMGSFFFQREDGRWDFTHKVFREGFRQRECETERINRALLKYWDTEDNEDEIIAREYVFHCIQGNAQESYVNYTNKNAWLSSRCEYHAAITWEYGRDWLPTMLSQETEQGIPEDFYTEFLLQFPRLGLPEEADPWIRQVLESTMDRMERRTELLLPRQIWESKAGSPEIGTLLTHEQWMELSRCGTLADSTRTVLAEQCEKQTDKIVLEQAVVLRRHCLERAWGRWDRYVLRLNHWSQTMIAERFALLANACSLLGEEGPLRETLSLSEDLQAYLGQFYLYQEETQIHAFLHQGRGDLYGALGGKENLRKAVDAYEQAIPLWNSVLEGDSETSAEELKAKYLIPCKRNLSRVYEALGSPEDLRKAINVYELASPSAVFSDHHIADLYERLGDRDSLLRALKHYEDLIEATDLMTDIRSLTREHSDSSVAYNAHIIRICKALGDREHLQKALDLCLRKLKITQDRKYYQPMETMEIYEEIVNICDLMGDPERARVYCEAELSCSDAVVKYNERVGFLDNYRLARALYRVSMRPDTPPERRIECLTRLRALAAQMSAAVEAAEVAAWNQACDEALGSAPVEKAPEAKNRRLKGFLRKLFGG